MSTSIQTDEFWDVYEILQRISYWELNPSLDTYTVGGLNYDEVHRVDESH